MSKISISYDRAGSSFSVETVLRNGIFATHWLEDGREISARRLMETAPAEVSGKIRELVLVSGCQTDGRPRTLFGQSPLTEASLQSSNHRAAMLDAIVASDVALLSALTRDAVPAATLASSCRQARDVSDRYFSSTERQHSIAKLSWQVAEAAEAAKASIDSSFGLNRGLRLRSVRMALARLSAAIGPDFKFAGFPPLSTNLDQDVALKVELGYLRNHAARFFAGLMGRQPRDEVARMIHSNAARHLLDETILPSCTKEWQRRASDTVRSLTAAQEIRLSRTNREVEVPEPDVAIAIEMEETGGSEIRKAFEGMLAGEDVGDEASERMIETLREVSRNSRYLGERASYILDEIDAKSQVFSIN